jgi:hypothetical protein
MSLERLLVAAALAAAFCVTMLDVFIWRPL